jgi:hypothetical protein
MRPSGKVLEFRAWVESVVTERKFVKEPGRQSGKPRPGRSESQPPASARKEAAPRLNTKPDASAALSQATPIRDTVRKVLPGSGLGREQQLRDMNQRQTPKNPVTMQTEGCGGRSRGVFAASLALPEVERQPDWG